MKTRTLYICEVCGEEYDTPEQATQCENIPLSGGPLPELGREVRLDGRTKIYTVVELGQWGHSVAFKTDPPCGDSDWGRGYEWWCGRHQGWKYVE